MIFVHMFTIISGCLSVTPSPLYYKWWHFNAQFSRSGWSDVTSLRTCLSLNGLWNLPVVVCISAVIVAQCTISLFMIWFGLRCFIPLSGIFQLYRGGQFIGGENRRPVASHWQIYHILLYRIHLAMNGVRTHNFSGDRHWLHW